MKRLAITGGIGSGKSTVCRLLAEVGGVEVYDSDSRAKEIMNSHPQVVAEVEALFGPEAYKEGVLNRPYIAQRAFADKELLGRLNAIVHPRVVEDYEQWVACQSGPYVVLESALLFSSPLEGHYDVSVAVVAPDEIRVQRCVARDGATPEQIRERMARQMSGEEFAKRADFVVNADGVEPLLPQVEALDKWVRELKK
ncbi:MAG: dephospho-CoA kinase [Tidjanibacter sp.]|nr:dephospho-CoA kinase [Tidjanibacter sp.]